MRVAQDATKAKDIPLTQDELDRQHSRSPQPCYSAQDAHETRSQTIHPEPRWNPWDRSTLYMPRKPDYIQDYDRLVSEDITLAEAVTLFLESAPHVKATEGRFKNHVFGPIPTGMAPIVRGQLKHVQHEKCSH